jgi:hypothetical protein
MESMLQRSAMLWNAPKSSDNNEKWIGWNQRYRRSYRHVDTEAHNLEGLSV